MKDPNVPKTGYDLRYDSESERFPELSYDAVVIGGGAAGMFAAVSAASRGFRVCIVEKNECLGRKLCITGKGRCNLTNDCGEDEFFDSIPENPKFMYSAFSRFSNRDVIAFFESIGVKTVTERGKRVFPVSQNAKDVRNALRDRLKALSVKVFYGTSVTDILAENGRVTGVSLSTNSMVIKTKAVVIATGGLSYPLTGSTGDGYVFARKFGHTTKNLYPGLVAVETAEAFCGKLSGLTLKNVSVSFSYCDKMIYRDFGELLFTHTGVSGPTVLSASFELAKRGFRDAVLSIDLKPALDVRALDARILREINAAPSKTLLSLLRILLPKSLAEVFPDLLGLRGDMRCCELTRAERSAVTALMKDLRLRVTGHRPFDEAIITVGGIDTKDVDPGTMGSKLLKGLYFAGEVLDVAGYTGGFNLTIAFSTGHLAGESVCEYVNGQERDRSTF
ncbi:MAG: NAD(P)/FAD-dependent oxidoreductase [Clostridia bacterium]|nr:NAD(P)/FAD-dependent oxidoreductase [Clostridia bacterium]